MTWADACPMLVLVPWDHSSIEASRAKASWVQIPAFPLSSWVALGMLFPRPWPQFPHL